MTLFAVMRVKYSESIRVNPELRLRTQPRINTSLLADSVTILFDGMKPKAIWAKEL